MISNISLDQVYGALILFGIFIIISWLIDRTLSKFSKHVDTSTSEIFQLLSNSQRAIFLVIGLILALTELGFNLSALVAGLGLTGFALGFALKDAVSNLVAGVMIVLYKTVELGDHIEIAGTKGEVININLRFVTIKSDECDNMMPNSLFLSKQLKKF